MALRSWEKADTLPETQPTQEAFGWSNQDVHICLELPMLRQVVLEDRVCIPMSLESLAAFRRWCGSATFPVQGRVDYLAGSIEVDMSPEDLHTHGKIKTEFVGVLWQRVKRDGLGELYTDSTRIVSTAADMSVEPDIVFVSEEALDSGRTRLVPKAGGGADRYVELEGSADVVVEIVSDASVRKDTLELPRVYFLAGIEEYWVVDARGDQVMFRIHRRGENAYEAVEDDADGYQWSGVLERRYRLCRGRNDRGRLTFDLDERGRPG